MLTSIQEQDAQILDTLRNDLRRFKHHIVNEKECLEKSYHEKEPSLGAGRRASRLWSVDDRHLLSKNTEATYTIEIDGETRMVRYHAPVGGAALKEEAMEDLAAIREGKEKLRAMLMASNGAGPSGGGPMMASGSGSRIRVDHQDSYPNVKPNKLQQQQPLARQVATPPPSQHPSPHPQQRQSPIKPAPRPLESSRPVPYPSGRQTIAEPAQRDPPRAPPRQMSFLPHHPPAPAPTSAPAKAAAALGLAPAPAPSQPTPTSIAPRHGRAHASNSPYAVDHPSRPTIKKGPTPSAAATNPVVVSAGHYRPMAESSTKSSEASILAQALARENSRIAEERERDQRYRKAVMNGEHGAWRV